MPLFDYHAVDAQQRPQDGVVEAVSLAAAVVELEAAGFTIWSIAQATDLPTAEGSPTAADPSLVAAVQRVLATRDQYVEPLTAYAQELPPSKRRRELKALLGALAKGSEEDALKGAVESPLAWGPLLGAAAVEGDGESVFARFVEREQPTSKLRRRRGSAMAYPLVVLGLALAVGWPIASFMLPAFREIYESFGLELPAFTRLVLSVGRFFERGGGYVILCLTAVLCTAWWSLPWWAPAWFVRMREMLTARSEGASIASARLTRAAADLVEAGLPSPLVLHTAGQSVGGFVGSQAGRLASTGKERPTAVLSRGQGSLAFALEEEMPTASRSGLLRDLSACHEGLAIGQYSWADGMAGPLATIAVGVVVGSVVLALFLPLINLIEGLT